MAFKSDTEYRFHAYLLYLPLKDKVVMKRRWMLKVKTLLNHPLKFEKQALKCDVANTSFQSPVKHHCVGAARYSAI